jgi:hypothetical protein
MRKNNPARTNPCNCEHMDHFTETFAGVSIIGRPHKRTKHRYMRVEASNVWAWAVGHVCQDCADTCMKDYVVKDHVCGTGDCHR